MDQDIQALKIEEATLIGENQVWRDRSKALREEYTQGAKASKIRHARLRELRSLIRGTPEDQATANKLREALAEIERLKAQQVA